MVGSGAPDDAVAAGADVRGTVGTPAVMYVEICAGFADGARADQEHARAIGI